MGVSVSSTFWPTLDIVSTGYLVVMHFSVFSDVEHLFYVFIAYFFVKCLFTSFAYKLCCLSYYRFMVSYVF